MPVPERLPALPDDLPDALLGIADSLSRGEVSWAEADQWLSQLPRVSSVSLEAHSRIINRLQGQSLSAGPEVAIRYASVVLHWAFTTLGGEKSEVATALLNAAAQVYELFDMPFVTAIRTKSRPIMIVTPKAIDLKVDEFERAALIYSNVALLLESANCRSRQAMSLFKAGRWRESANAHEKAGQCFFSEHEPSLAADSWMAGASLLEMVGDFVEALSLLDRVEKIQTERGSGQEAARCSMRRAAILIELGRYDESLAAYDRAELVLRRYLPEPQLASCRLNRALTLMQLGRFAEAIGEFERIEPILEAHGEKDTLYRCRAGLSRSLYELGRYKEALEVLRRVFSKDVGSRSIVEVPSAEVASKDSSVTNGERDDEESIDAVTLAQFLPPAVHSSDLSELLLIRSKCLIRLRRFQDALAESEITQKYLSEIGVKFDVAMWHMICAEAMHGMGKIDQAIARYNHAGEEFHTQKKEMDAALCWRFQAALLHETSRFSEAIHQSERAAAIYDRIGCPVEAAECRFILAVSANKLRNHALCLTAAELAESPLERAGRLSQASDCRILIARSLTDLGRPEVAIHAYDRLLDHPLSETNRASLEYERAVILSDLGRYQAALSALEKCMKTVAELSSPFKVAVCFMQRANILRELGRCRESLADYSRSLELLTGPESVPDDREHRIASARCHLNIGNTMLELGHEQLAERFYAVAHSGFFELGEEVESARSQKNRAAVLIGSGRYLEAVVLLHEALPIFIANDRLREAVLCRINLSTALCTLGRPEEAVKLLEPLEPEGLADDLQLQYYEALGSALDAAGQRSEAIVMLLRGRQALRRSVRSSGVTVTDLEFVAKRQRLVRRSVDLARDADHIASAFDAVQDGKAVLLGDTLSRDGAPIEASITDDVMTARVHLCKALIDENNHVSPSDEHKAEPLITFRSEQLSTRVVETHSLARAYLSAWQNAQTNKLRAQRSSANEATSPVIMPQRTTSLDQVQACLPDGWAILDFWCRNAEDIDVFIVTRSGLRVEPIKVPTSSRDIRVALRDLESWSRSAIPGRDHALDTFFEKLFEPLMPRIKEYQGLYLVPHSYLHSVPLHACHIGDGRYLGDIFDIGYLPSSSLLPILPPMAAFSGHSITLANPERGSASTLPFSDWEAERVQRSLSLHQHRVWTGPSATIDKVMNWNSPSLVHFSCHATGDSGFSALSHLRLADDLLLAHDILHRMPSLTVGALAFLNGCKTGTRDWRAVDEGMGLMSAFLLRGASLVAASTWSMNDFCAAEMATTFLESVVRDGRSPGESLRAAQLRARKLTLDDVESSCRELLDEKFRPSEFPDEAIIVSKAAMQACLKGDQIHKAREYARLASEALRKLGKLADAEQIESDIQGMAWHGGSNLRSMAEPAFDHPVYWSAIQLIGRVT